jgi:hypothetical protein
VFLGAIAVADRTDLKRHLEQEGVFEDEPLDSALRRALTEIFSLPPADSVEDPLSTDLVLDVWIPKYQSGEVLDVYLGDAGISLWWRPKVTVSSRLSSLLTKQTKVTFSVTERMKWKHFLARVFSWRGFFLSQPFVRQDMEQLLCQACATLLTKMQKAL